MKSKAKTAKRNPGRLQRLVSLRPGELEILIEHYVHSAKSIRDIAAIHPNLPTLIRGAEMDEARSEELRKQANDRHEPPAGQTTTNL